MKKAIQTTKPNPLDKRAAENRRRASISPELAQQMLARYLSKDLPPTSYRKLAFEHGKTANAVMRALRRASEEKP